METFRCKAVLFDLDGVLVDSTRSVERQWRLWAREHNVDPEAILEIAHGRRTVEIIQLLAPHLDLEMEVARVERREAEDTDGLQGQRVVEQGVARSAARGDHRKRGP